MRLFLSAFFEPIGIGLKFVALAIALSRPSFASIAFLLIITIFLAVGFVVSFLRSSHRNMLDLQTYMSGRQDATWFCQRLPLDFYSDGLTTTPVNALVASGNAYMLSYLGNVATDTVCYYNFVGNTYILTPNAGECPVDIPLMQQFVILHELGHASWAGGAAWIQAWPNCIFWILALLLGWHVTAGGIWWGLPVTIITFLYFVGHALQGARIQTAELFADRYAIKRIADRDIAQALRVSGQLIKRWRAPAFNGKSELRRRLELRARIAGLQRLIWMLERATAGRAAVDIDRLPKLITHLPEYVLAVALATWVYIWLGNVNESNLSLLVIGFTVAIVLMTLCRNALIRRIVEVDKSIRKACRL